jgi:TatD DNase family protein
MQTIATTLPALPGILAIADAFPSVYASVGVHPCEVATHLPFTVEDLVREAAHPKIIGLGETGLDYYHDASPATKASQHTAFRAHIAAAHRTGLPLIVHSRDADDDTLTLLQEGLVQGPLRIVMHCFSGSYDFAQACVALGAVLSFSGILTFKTASALREVVATLPLDRILVETDAPYLAPTPHRGTCNAPCWTYYVAQAVADCQHITLADVARATTDTFLRVFSKVPREALYGHA